MASNAELLDGNDYHPWLQFPQVTPALIHYYIHLIGISLSIHPIRNRNIFLANSPWRLATSITYVVGIFWTFLLVLGLSVYYVREIKSWYW
jgi:hypothetical protein